jgi:dTMP kinase
VKGILITLEGIDGSGKTTVSGILASRLSEALPEVRLVLTAQPTESETGRILRSRLSSIPCECDVSLKARRMEELFLFMADHADHLARTIIPSLNAGAVVISDRYADSTAAYQGVTLRGIVRDPIQWIREVYMPWNIVPDTTILFSIDPTSALKRIRSRENMERFERIEFLKSVDENFRYLAALEPRRFVFVDASKSADDVADEALTTIIGRVLGSQA